MDDSRPYLRGTVTYVADQPGANPPTAAVVQAFAGYCATLADVTGNDVAEPALPEDDPALVSWVVAAAMRLDLPEKQALLATDDTAVRLRRELTLLRRETALLRASPAESPTEGPFSLN